MRTFIALIASFISHQLWAGDIPLVERQQWGAKKAQVGLMKRHAITGILIHHTSVRQQPRLTVEKKMRGLQSFSQRPGRVGRRRKPVWGDVPYHYYIGVSGRIAEGRSLGYAGDTNTRYNTLGWAQIVLEGNFTKEQPNEKQLMSLFDLVVVLAKKHPNVTKNIAGHNDQASTNCPGPNLKRYLPKLREHLAKTVR
ncbi:MAG: peptidoglycan recognition protein family protein [Hyphomicrobiaceae bacterium]